jgi:hypothetical protein
MTADSMSAAAVRKCVFALRSMLDAAIADQRLAVNPAANVPLPTEHAAEQRFLDQEQSPHPCRPDHPEVSARPAASQGQAVC